VKYIVEDTETNPTIGSRKFRKLALEANAAVVLGSVHSGVMMATVPLAKELTTPYFPLGMAYEATGPLGNRYVFRINSQVREQEAASSKWMVANVAKKWTIVVTDYAWGHSHEDWFEKGIQANGGSILAKVRIPQGNKDFLPYLGKIPKETEGIYFIFFGADSIGFLSQLAESGYSGAKFTMICSLEAIDLPKMGSAVEGMYMVEYMPRELSEFDTPHNRAFRKALGVDENGNEIGNPSRVVAGSHYWASYEHVYLIKQAMEKCNWQSKKDTPKLIETIESITELPEGPHFPQGTAVFRPQDHQGFHKHYMSRIQNGRLKVQFEIPTRDVIYPAETDFPREKP
jgi:branched-chain amino acid transport system substrate-binding protein